MLTLKEFIQKSQGNFQNDNLNLWVETDGIVAIIELPEWSKKFVEKEDADGFAISYVFDDMKLNEAMGSEDFYDLYLDWADKYIKENTDEGLNIFVDLDSWESRHYGIAPDSVKFDCINFKNFNSKNYIVLRYAQIDNEKNRYFEPAVKLLDDGSIDDYIYYLWYDILDDYDLAGDGEDKACDWNTIAEVTKEGKINEYE